MNRRARWLLGVAVVFVASVSPAVAEASVASKSGNTITIAAGAGETNNIQLRSECCYYIARISDAAGITAADGCFQETATLVNCDSTRPNPDVVVTLGDGNDKLTILADPELASLNADGGPGDDEIYSDGTTDLIRGGDGNDSLGASAGEDQVFGEGGDDIVVGGSGADRVSGGSGKDRIEGDGTLSCCWGSDTIDSRDGEVDQVSCGLGSDVVTGDAVDVFESGECESLDLAGSAGPGPGGTGGAFAITLGSKSRGSISNLTSRSGFKFAVAVSEPCRATLKFRVTAANARKVRLGRGAVTLASQSEAIPEAGTYAGALPVARKWRAKLRRLRRVSTTLSFACASGGDTQRASRRVTFTR